MKEKHDEMKVVYDEGREEFEKVDFLLNSIRNPVYFFSNLGTRSQSKFWRETCWISRNWRGAKGKVIYITLFSILN